MSWVYLFIAGIFEIVWAVALKHADGFSNWFYSTVTIIGMVASVYFLAVAMRTIPLGTAYAIWTGIGCIGAFIAGILLFGEAFTVSRTVFASLIAIGIIGLKFSASLFPNIQKQEDLLFRIRAFSLKVD